MSKEKTKEQEEKPQIEEPVKVPLNQDEQDELEQLESACLNQGKFPDFMQMRRLGVLRTRPHKQFKIINCDKCHNNFVTSNPFSGMACRLCGKNVAISQEEMSRGKKT